MATPSDLVAAYRFFRAHAGYRVGHAAEGALALARAELAASARGLEYAWEWDHEAEECPDGCEVLICIVCRPGDVDEREGTVRRGACGLVNLGGIVLESPAFIQGESQDPYTRVVEAELAIDALEILDAEDAIEARALEGRATFAAGVADGC